MFKFSGIAEIKEQSECVTEKNVWNEGKEITGNITAQIWSHLLKKPLMENFIFCAVYK